MENLNLIAVITDENFGLPKKDLVNPYKRYGARGIIYREDGKVALLYKAKMNEYKLPGGGIDEGETPIKAFERECMEEAGCILKNIIPLGYTEEKKGKTDFYQKSYVFIGEVLEDTGVVNFTEKEIAEGAQIVWVTMEEALELVGSSLNNVLDSPIDEDESAYATRFVVYRDRLIIDYYINNFKN
jgi:8-oxo-dGTP diphosphatase